MSLIPLSGAAVVVFINNDQDPATRFPLCVGPCARGNITNYKWSSVLSDSRGRVVGECLFAIDSTGVRSSMAVPFAEHSDLVREGPFTVYNCFTSLLLPFLYSLCTLQWPRPRLALRTTVNT